MIFDKLFGLLLVLTCLSACENSIPKPVPVNAKTDEFIHQDSLVLVPERGLVHYLGKPFSGAAVSFYPNGNIAVRNEYAEGKKHGVCSRWFVDGTISYESEYSKGKKHGSTKTWWRNGNIRSAAQLKEGTAQGLQKQWYKSGALFKVRNIVDGKEEGLQQSWRENGKLYNNYEAKNGRIFGLKRAELCFELDNEKITASIGD